VDFDCSSNRNDFAFTLIKFFDLQRLLFNKSLRNKLVNLIGITWHSRDLIYEVAVTEKVDNRDVLDPEQLSNVLMFVDVNI